MSDLRLWQAGPRPGPEPDLPAEYLASANFLNLKFVLNVLQ